MDKPVRTVSAISDEKLPPTEMRLADIPRILFDELSARIGCGEETTIRLTRGEYRMRPLAENHKLVGFAGAIGLKVSGETVHFVLWGCCPESTDWGSVFEPQPNLTIKAGPASGGVWAYGRGNLVREAISAELAYGDSLDLEAPSVTLIALILVRAHQLACNPSLVKQEYWDGLGDKP